MRAGDIAAVILAGGAGRRMGGVDKPALKVSGRRMLDRVLEACRDTAPRVVVGPARDLPPDVLGTTEDPPGGGPVAAIAAGLAQFDPLLQPSKVVIVAADMPLLDRVAVHALEIPYLMPGGDGVAPEVVFYVDKDGQRQLLCGLWCVIPLRIALGELAAERPEGLVGASMRALAAKLTVSELTWRAKGPPPWYDCDTEEDLREAQKLARRQDRRNR